MAKEVQAQRPPGGRRRAAGRPRRWWRRLDAFVKRTHANWFAAAGILVALALGLDWSSDEAARPEPQPTTSGARVNEALAGKFGPERTDAGNSAPCAAAYAGARKAEFAALIAAEARRCAGALGQPSEVSWSCRVDGGVHELELEHRFGPAPDGERPAFSAQYRGARDVDLGQVNVGPVNSAARNLCRSGGPAERR